MSLGAGERVRYVHKSIARRIKPVDFKTPEFGPQRRAIHYALLAKLVVATLARAHDFAIAGVLTADVGASEEDREIHPVVDEARVDALIVRRVNLLLGDPVNWGKPPRVRAPAIIKRHIGRAVKIEALEPVGAVVASDDQGKGNQKSHTLSSEVAR